MSTTIDEKVVELQFDNSNFEKNIDSTIKSLEKLKESLNMSGSAKGFSEIDKAANSVNFGGLTTSIETVKTQFSALQVVGITTIANITTALEEKLVGGFTSAISQIKSGGLNRALNIEQAQFQLEGLGVAWDDIQQNINDAVSGTAYGLDAAAKVAAQLVASNVEYGDATSEMAEALRGISGVAAMTNSTYEDIGNIFTTVAGNGRLYTIQLQQLASRGLNAASTLADYLGVTEAEVREMTTQGEIDFNTFATAMNEAFGEHATKANETYSGSLSNVNAALSRIGEKFQTIRNNKMKNIFNALIPVLNQVKTALQPIVDIYSEIAESSSSKWVSFLNSISSTSRTLTVDELNNSLGDATTNSEALRKAIVKAAQDAGAEIDDTATILDGIRDGWLTTDVISSTFSSITDIINGTITSAETATVSLEKLEKIANKVIRGDYGNGYDRVKALTAAGYDYASVQSIVNNKLLGTEITISDLSDTQLENIGYTEAEIEELRLLAEQAEQTGTPLNELLNGTAQLSTVELLIGGIANGVKAFKGYLDAAKSAWNNTFNESNTSLLRKFATGFYNFANSLILSDENSEKLTKTFQGLFSVLDILGTIVKDVISFGFNTLNRILGGKLNGNILNLTGNVGDVITAFHDWFIENDFIAGALEKIYSTIGNVIDIVRDFIGNNKTLSSFFSNLKSGFKSATTDFDGFVKNSKALSTLKAGISRFWNFIKPIFGGLGTILSGAGAAFTEIKDRILELDSISLSGILGVLKDFFTENKEEGFQKVSTDVNNTSSAIVNFKEVLRTALTSLGEWFNATNKKVQEALEPIKEWLSSVDWSKWLSVGITVASGYALIRMLTGLSRILQRANTIRGSFITMLGSISGVFKEFKKGIRAKMLLTSAEAIFVLAAALVMLTKVDQNKLASAAAIIGVLFGEIALAVYGLGTTGKGSLSGALSIQNLVTVLIGVSASILILAFALERLSKFDWLGYDGMLSNIGKVLLAFGALAGGAWIFSKIGGMDKIAVTPLIALAAALFIMTESLKVLSGLDTKSIMSNMAPLIEIFGLYAALMVATRIAGVNAAKAGVALLAFSVSLYLLLGAIKLLGSMSQSDLNQGLAAVSGMIVLFGLLSVLSSFSGKNAAKAGVLMLGFSAAVLIMVGAISLLSLIKPSDIVKGELALAGMVTMMGILMVFSSMTGQANFKNIISLAAAIAVMSVSIAALSLIDPAKLLSATAALSAVMGMMSLMMFMSSNTKDVKLGPIVAMMVILGEVTAALMLLGNMNPQGLMAAATGISELITVLAGVMYILSKTNLHIGGKEFISIQAMVAVMAEVALILGLLSKFTNPDSVVPIATALSTLLVVLTGCTAMLSAGFINPAAALTGIEGLAVVLAGIAGIVSIAAGISQIPGFNEFMSSGLSTLQEFANGIGKVIGDFIGGIGEGMSASLPDIGANLTNFMNNMQGFFSGLETVDESTLQSVAYLCDIMSQLSSMQLGTSFKQFLSDLFDPISGDSNMDSFMKMLVGENGDGGLAAGIMKFAEQTAGIVRYQTPLTTATSSLKEIIEACNSIPNEGGLLSLLSGDNKADKFAQELEPLANGLTAFANNSATISLDNIFINRVRITIFNFFFFI